MTGPTTGATRSRSALRWLTGALRRRLAALARGGGAFARGPGARRRLAVEAAWQLTRARLATIGPRPAGVRTLGRRGAVTTPVGPEAEALAAEIGAVVAAVAAAAPYRARCLQQALAVRGMLARRGIPSVLHIGMARQPARGDAHAWVTAGGRVVSGDTDLDRFVVIDSFS